MGLTRKVLRFGKLLQLQESIFKKMGIISKGKISEESLDKNECLYWLITKLLAEIGLSIFFFFDHIVYLNKIKLMNKP